MKCPVCKRKMKLKAHDLTYGKENKLYDRTIYNCDDCDTWISEEIPKNG